MKPFHPIVSLAFLCTSAGAQFNGFDVVVDHQVSPDQPSTEVQIWARFDPQYYAFAQSGFDILTDSGTHDEGVWSDLKIELVGPEESLGTLSDADSDVLDVFIRQLHGHPFIADPSNPILLWRATWTTNDFSHRRVQVDIDPHSFEVWVDEDYWFPVRKDVMGENWQDIPSFIWVVPAPGASGLGIGFAMLAIGRRR